MHATAEHPGDQHCSRVPQTHDPTQATIQFRRLPSATAAPRWRPGATTFIGRLGTYRYYNMDQCVGLALAEFDRLEQLL